MGQPMIAESRLRPSAGSAAQARPRRPVRPAARQLRLLTGPDRARPAPLAPEAAPLLRFQPTLAPQSPPAIDPLRLVQATVGPMPELRAIALDDGDLAAALLARGDLVLVRGGGPTPAEGELWALRLPGRERAVLRRIHAEDGRWRLQPDNRSFPPEILDPIEVQLDGRVIAVLRQHGEARGHPDLLRPELSAHEQTASALSGH